MPFPRLTAAPAIRSLLIRSPPTSRQFVRRLTQNSGQGGSYASTGRTHGNMGKKGSDTPWMIGAVAFTVPACFYLLSGSPKPAHHSNDHSHAAAAKDEGSKAAPEEKGASEVDAEATEQSSETDSTSQDISEAASDARDKASDKASEVSEKVGEAKDNAKAKVEDVKEKGGEVVEGVKGELKKKAGKVTGSKKDADDSEESEPSSKDESKEPAAEPKEEKEPKPPAKKSIDSNKPALGNSMKGKQQGLSNDDTAHAILHDERGDAISKKGEGLHDTAKIKGTVDPSRPAK